MKKKLTLILVLMMFSSGLFAEDIILRHNRGLFGYKMVTVSQNPVGNYLSCLDPGKKSCRWSMGGKDEEYSAIVGKVDEACINGSTSGEFQDGAYFVKYTFEKEDDKLEIRIYTLNEARDRGFM